jgi:lysozyme
VSYLHRAATLLRQHEGLKLTPYKCTAGALTIGYGHNIDANGLPAAVKANLDRDGKITQADAEALLLAGIQRAENDCRRLFPRFENMSDARKAALIDWLFNLGRGTAQKFTDTIHFINAGLWEDAADAMMDSRWARQVGKRAETVTDMVREG